MDCALQALMACFSLSGIYFDSGISVQDYEPAYLHRFDYQYIDTGAVQETSWREEISHRSRNPYGRLSLGYELDFKSIRIALEAMHNSSIATKDDKGVNSLSLTMRWYPFRQ